MSNFLAPPDNIFELLVDCRNALYVIAALILLRVGCWVFMGLFVKGD